MAKFLKRLNLQICKYWYILAAMSKLKLIWINQLKTCRNPKTHHSGLAFSEQP